MTTSALVEARSGRRRQLRRVLMLTSSYLAIEVVGGLVTGSLALLADAGHMLTDVGGLVLALLALKLADLPPSSRRSYGYYRAEILAALTNALVLIAISIYILWEAYQRYLHPPAVQTGWMLLIAVIGLAVNVVGIVLLREGAGESLNVRGAYFEVLSDTLSSVGVIVAAIVMATTGWYYADPLISAAIGLFILPRTWALLRDVTNILLEATPADVDVVRVYDAIRTTPGVRDVHDLHVWAITSGLNALSVHVRAASAVATDQILAAVHASLTPALNVHHLTVQVEPDGWVEPKGTV